MEVLPQVKKEPIIWVKIILTFFHFTIDFSINNPYYYKDQYIYYNLIYYFN
jgi:hypothetical protein